MNLALWKKTIREGFWLLVGCAALMALWQWIRVWATGQISMKDTASILAHAPGFVQNLIPVELKVLITPAGRIAIGYEEPFVLVVLCLWGVARGSDSVSGEINRGTMELLLAQPVSRLSVLLVHSITSLAGVVVMIAAAWLGTYVGLHTIELERTVEAAYFLPAALNLLCLGLLVVALATMFSAFDFQRGRTIGLAVGFIVIELILKIFVRVSEGFDWLRYATVLTAFEPQIAVRSAGTPDSPMFVYNSLLVGLTALFFLIAAVAFTHRDVPAPL
jgi:beta-exotoxin I transport system permease protein